MVKVSYKGSTVDDLVANAGNRKWRCERLLKEYREGLVIAAARKCRHAKKHMFHVRASIKKGGPGNYSITHCPFTFCQKCGYAESSWGMGEYRLDKGCSRFMDREKAEALVHYFVPDEDMEAFIKNDKQRKPWPERLVDRRPI